jgi:hypothetical protein
MNLNKFIISLSITYLDQLNFYHCPLVIFKLSDIFKHIKEKRKYNKE